MLISELLPEIQSLSRPDKLRLAQLLIVDLAREEGRQLGLDTPLDTLARHNVAIMSPANQSVNRGDAMRA